jgi:hypothetical protein
LVMLAIARPPRLLTLQVKIHPSGVGVITAVCYFLVLGLFSVGRDKHIHGHR